MSFPQLGSSRMAIFVFGLLSDADVEWIAQAGVQRPIRNGEVLIEEGQPVNSVIFLLQGECVVTERSAGEIARLVGRRDRRGNVVFGFPGPFGDRDSVGERSRPVPRQGNACG